MPPLRYVIKKWQVKISVIDIIQICNTNVTKKQYKCNNRQNRWESIYIDFAYIDKKI